MHVDAVLPCEHEKQGSFKAVRWSASAMSAVNIATRYDAPPFVSRGAFVLASILLWLRSLSEEVSKSPGARVTVGG